MAIHPGTRLGVYEVVARIGAGGMGEVYRARDPQLNRDVAIKLLHAPDADDPERLDRFSREAHLLAALSHPNIAHVYGFEAARVDGGSSVLIMELVEGDTLAERLAAGPLPVDEAVPIARQIAEALEFAHERGIIHRDLKPANVKLRPDGLVKVLDFGLAKALDAGEAPLNNVMNSPTLLAGTEVGMILGTASYMAPEQARGRAVDRRADIWAFGAVLFEMLSGRRAFDGTSSSEILAAVLKDDPPWSALPSDLPPGIVTLMRRCLERDARQRLRDMGEARIALEQPTAANAVTPSSTVVRGGFTWLPWAVAGALAIALLGVLLKPSPAVSPLTPLRFSIASPTPAALPRQSLTPVLAVSPNGQRIAVADSEGLWLWAAESGDWDLLPDTAGAISPFFSPDGTHLAFFAGGELRRLATAGGPPSLIARAPAGNAGTWSADDTILYTRWLGQDAGLWLVPARGGDARLLVPAPNPSDLRAFPSWLPDSRHYVFLQGAYGNLVGKRQVCVGSIDGGDPQCLASADSLSMYSPTGHLLFVRAGTLVALPFDVASLRALGEATTIEAETRWFGPTGIAHFAVSADGRALVHTAPPSGRRLEWVSRTGAPLGPLGAPAHYGLVELSPAGDKLAVEIWNERTGGRDLWTIDVATGVPTRVTFEPIDALLGAWLDDGALAFARPNVGPPDLSLIRIDRSSPPETLLQAPGVQIAQHWQSSPGVLAYIDFSPDRSEQRQIWLRSPGGDTRRFSATPANTWDPRFSRDGRRMAFVSDESGAPEVYVTSGDNPSAARRLSRAGGFMPKWRGDGRELFFVQPDGLLMSVSPDAPGVPTPLFRLEGVTRGDADYPGRERSVHYDVTADGQRFVIRTNVIGTEAHALRMHLHWTARQ
jgi:serine/threonine protein kinase/Tol biopolymer transport system component